MIMMIVPMKQMHERTSENKDEWCVREDMLPVADECDNHHARKEVIEPVGDAEVLHRREWGTEK